MFLRDLGARDPRFKTARFHDGLNLVVAERTDESSQGDSRNGTGKSSLVRILRFLLGGQLPDDLHKPALEDQIFTASLTLPTAALPQQSVQVARAVATPTRVAVTGWAETGGRQDVHIDEWRSLVATHVFGLPSDAARPTTGQLWGQLVRTSFGEPTKVFPNESDWEVGVRLGYLLGMSPEVLSKAGAVGRLEKQRQAVRAAVREGALTHLALDEAALRSQLAAARRQRDQTRESLGAFRVDEQYGEHQRVADALSAEIRLLNDEAVALERRATELRRATESDTQGSPDGELERRVAQVYGEMQVVLPEAVVRRFDEVAAFNTSVLRNRRIYLEQEQRSVAERMEALEDERRRLDGQRQEVMRILVSSVALDTFLEGQRALAAKDAAVADLERRLESASSMAQLTSAVRIATAEAVEGVRGEIADRAPQLDRPIALFSELGSEIYADREARLLVAPAPKGALRVTPQIDGDASDGIRGVETFLLDMVSMATALPLGRVPGLLVHDSHLFDSVDHRQVASCLNIGARLAAEIGFQYVVTMNSDFLASVESEGGFDRSEYLVPMGLTDSSEDGGIFGFRFD